MDKVQSACNNIVFIPEERIGLYNSKTFQKGLEEMIAEGYSKIIIDFENVKSIDCAAIGIIYKVQRKLQEQQGEMKVINVNNQHIQNLFRLIKLNKIIKII